MIVFENRSWLTIKLSKEELAKEALYIYLCWILCALQYRYCEIKNVKLRIDDAFVSLWSRCLWRNEISCWTQLLNDLKLFIVLDWCLLYFILFTYIFIQILYIALLNNFYVAICDIHGKFIDEYHKRNCTKQKYFLI